MVSHVLLLGDVVIDRSYEGKSRGLSPDAPVPVVNVDKITSNLGGIGNVIRSLTDFFDTVHYITSLCYEDANTVESYLGGKVRYTNFEQNDRRVTVINRVIADNRVLSRFDHPSNTSKLCSENEDRIVDYIGENLLHYLDVVILSDYDRGSLTDSLCSRVIKICNETEVRVLVDPKLPNWSKFNGATLIKPNREEASNFTGKLISITDDITGEDFALAALAKCQIPYILNTLDKDGMVLYYLDKDSKLCALRKSCAENSIMVDVTGCGDAIIAAIAIFLKHGGSLKDKENELVNILTSVGKMAIEVAGSYILNSKDWDKIVTRPIRVVFTNGCFDLMHIGHLRLLKYCRSLGGHFIIGINSDRSVKMLKGDSRPINPLETRIKFLEELELAHEVIAFDEETPIKLINRIKPDVLVKGGDYALENVVGGNVAGQTLIYPLEAGFSSTAIIETIKRKHIK